MAHGYLTYGGLYSGGGGLFSEVFATIKKEILPTDSAPFPVVMGDTTSIGFDTIPITFGLKYRGIDYPNNYFLQFSKSYIFLTVPI
jgi:hypothetical protein